MDCKRTLLLLAIFVAAFLFRVAVIFHNEYPPSSDIGFHSSIINLILDDGKLSSWNPYHMGGESLATPPGYHLFATIIVLFTGMPILLAQMVIAALFSSFTVFPTYLFSKKMWRNNGAGFLSAFLVTVSSLSMEMLGWGGYPNIVSLAFIVLVFYLFVKELNRPNRLYLVAAALITSALLLTHLFSLFVLFSILAMYIFLLLIGKALRRIEANSVKVIRFFLVSVALGTLFASPWLLGVATFYVDMSSEGAFLGGMEETRNLILANRYVDIRILVLIGAIIPTLFMFKGLRRRYIDAESLLLIAWFLVPLVLTQAYIFGIFVDYSRFMYFADFPGLLMISAALLHLFRYLAVAQKRLFVSRWSRRGKTASQVALPAILLVVYLVFPSLITPMEALARTGFYTSVMKPEATALEWIQTRTEDSSVLVSDHLYGWWLSGVAQRSTLSAVSPEFLLYPHEVEVANSARILLDTDYYIDNGLIQVREDGGYLARHNPIFIIDREQQLPYSVFHFNEEETTLFVQQGRTAKALDLNALGTPETHLEVNSVNTVLTTIRENGFLRINKTLTIRRGVRFAELSHEVRGINSQTTINWVRFILHLRRGKIVTSEEMMGLFDYNAMVTGQIIFEETCPKITYTQEAPSSVEFLYSTKNATSVRIKLLVGLFDVSGVEHEEVLEKLDDIPEDPMDTVDDSPIVTLSYLEIIKRYNITFVVCRDQEFFAKFAENTKFRTVYDGQQVAIFQVTS